jgi:uncharacterized membrane protein YjgN (DUF898 family)
MAFSFRLKGKDWFGLYLAVLVFYFVPAIALQLLGNHMKSEPKNLIDLLYMLCIFSFMVFVLLLLATPVLKKIINNIYLNDRPLKYSGDTAEFFFMNIGNLLLSVITLGVYFPWYMTRLMKYLVGKTSYEDNNFCFNGKGLHLFGLLLATLALPIALFSIIIAFLARGHATTMYFTIMSQALAFLIVVPYIYWVYKWVVNITFKEYLITWETSAIPSLGKIFMEMALTLVTVGIYYPAAIAKLYGYFMDRTIVSKMDFKVYSFNVELNYFKVWKFLWIQILLTLITCGIYGAWAYCNVCALILNNTSLSKLETSN